MQFFIKMIPPTITAQEHRIGRYGVYKSTEQKQAYVKLRDARVTKWMVSINIQSPTLII